MSYLQFATLATLASTLFNNNGKARTCPFEVEPKVA